MNTTGTALRLTLFGESHGPGVGCVLEGLPAGTPIDEATLRSDMDLRRPGQPNTSARSEPDDVTFLSGVTRGPDATLRATGTPLAIWIPNTDARPQDYDLAGPRPGHADWTQHVASGGHADLRGGGFHSGRLTAPIVAAGSLARAVLAPRGIEVAASLVQAGGAHVPEPSGDAASIAAAAHASRLRCASRDGDAALGAAIDAARRAGDSVGGVVAFVADGLPAGLGAPHFGGLEPRVGALLLAIPGVRGVEFGAGFAAASQRGTEHNDPFVADGSGGLRPVTNVAGGALGGRATGLPLRGRVAFKPASSVSAPQGTAAWDGTPVALRVTGRHDPCIAVRGVAVVEACVRLAVADLVLMQDGTRPHPAPRAAPEPRAAAPTGS